MREGQLESSPIVELSPQEAMALIQIANAGGMRAGAVSESDLSRLHLLGLVEQRGIAMGLTATGIQTIARLRQGQSLCADAGGGGNASLASQGDKRRQVF